MSTPLTVKGSYIYTDLKLFQPFEGNSEADVAPGENEFYAPVVKQCFALPVNILSQLLFKFSLKIQNVI